MKTTNKRKLLTIYSAAIPVFQAPHSTINSISRGFNTILAAQFFSSLADNALLFAAIAVLKDLDAPAWQTPVLQQFFVFAFIGLAPFVGAFSDALPKGRVMFISNSIKIAGCTAMLSGLHPLLAYGFVGIGAAMYSPAKYGILTEYLPPCKLVWANAWMEGLTVAAIILGAILGGLLIGHRVEDQVVRQLGGLEFNGGIDTAPEFAILVILGLYFAAAILNYYIPRLPIEHPLSNRTPRLLLADFRRTFLLLWQDSLGQVSLAVTSLFWGAGTSLRFIILAWAAAALNLDLEQATQLTALVAVGLAIGSVAAAKAVPLAHAVKVLPLGIVMGLAVSAMAWITDWRLAVLMLILIGILAGSFLIPMNALLQHRGHQLMGSGHSIAVQNFNENLSILLMLGAYALMIRARLSVNAIVIVFGLVVSVTMAMLTKKHGHDQD
ncbi:Lysophospholipid transporter LplT [Candidatus Methylobacter favarea]|uniref:Lysophospholipid transporter LplT n=1 Tax=Candidatus Methylobacter favarea TaxID=2707345 RepID=A0A8S0WC34_9GAMM|nr:lysophospholipid transporter LplT [Candidatus Methylobacter favarea]CAA9892155.1 Lysophospholipid transporter LplT [Candidatus Methylobacter favarea]